MLNEIKNSKYGNNFHRQIINQKSNKILEITIENGEFFKSFNYFIVVQFNEKKERTRVSKMTPNPLFKGNKIYFPFQEYDLLISQTLTFSAFIIIKENQSLNNKLLGKNIFELSALGDSTNYLKVPITRKIELYQKVGDIKSIIGKITVKLRLLIDEKEEIEQEERELGENEKEEIKQEEGGEEFDEKKENEIEGIDEKEEIEQDLRELEVNEKEEIKQEEGREEFDEKEENEIEGIHQEEIEQEERDLVKKEKEEIEQEERDLVKKEKEEIEQEENEPEEKEIGILLNKLNFLKKHILDFLNIKLNVSITGKEKNLDLNNKNIGNFELMLIIEIISDNLESINLSHNNISDVRPLGYLKNLKRIDLSYNNLKDFPFNSVKIKKNNPSPSKNISFNLDNNGLIEKEINEIKDIITNDYETYLNSDNDKDHIQNKLINKLNQLEQKILKYFNNKLNVQLIGKEISIDLNNKNIENIDLSLLSSIDFKNLEEINLSNNKISNIEPLKNFKNLKKIDLSFNEIIKIDELKNISENNNKIEILYLNDNMIEDAEILKQNIFPNIIEVNLDNNNIIKKEIEEIKMMVKKNKNKKIKIECIINYKVIKNNTEIRLFGEEFIRNNRDNYEIKINGINKKIKETFFVDKKGNF